jgi:hypothetical protein
VDAVFAVADDFEDLVDAYLAGISDFQGAPGAQIAVQNRENDCLEEGLVLRIKRTVDENALVVLISSHRTPALAVDYAGRRRLS